MGTDIWRESEEWKIDIHFQGLLRAFEQGSGPAIILLIYDMGYPIPTTSQGRPVWEELEMVDTDHQVPETPPDPRAEYLWPDFRPDELNLGQTGVTGPLWSWWPCGGLANQYQLLEAAIMNFEKCPKVVNWTLPDYSEMVHGED